MLPPNKIILASQSPRRKELLTMAGLHFEIRTKEVSEEHPDNLAPSDLPLYLAQKKARALWAELQPNEVVIGADTVVILDNCIFEKPADAADAERMLRQLSGHTHTVVTGVCLLSYKKEISFTESTRVSFNELTDEEINYYVKTYQPYDKAGSYACQEWIGAVGIACFEGDYFNVVGLPVNRVYQLLKTF